jgi:hypothetical protein
MNAMNGAPNRGERRTEKVGRRQRQRRRRFNASSPVTVGAMTTRRPGRFRRDRYRTTFAVAMPLCSREVIGCAVLGIFFGHRNRLVNYTRRTIANDETNGSDG